MGDKMYNWSVDLGKLGKNSEKAKIWKLEQIVNFGLNNEKLDRNLLKKYWGKLCLDPSRKKFFNLLLWQK